MDITPQTREGFASARVKAHPAVISRPAIDRHGIPYRDHQVTSSGHVLHNGVPVKESVNHDGYHTVRLPGLTGSTSERVHVLVARAFRRNDDPEHQIEIDHVNGVKSDNSACNLDHVTKSENIRRMHASGNRKKSERTLTVADAVEIRRLNAQGVTKTDIAERYNVQRQTVGDVCRYDVFPNAGCTQPPLKLTNILIFLTRVWIILGVPVEAIARCLGISRRTILKAHQQPAFIEFWHRWLRYLATGDHMPTWGEPKVSDALVRAYVKRLNAGVPLHRIVPLRVG